MLEKENTINKNNKERKERARVIEKVFSILILFQIDVSYIFLFFFSRISNIKYNIINKGGLGFGVYHKCDMVTFFFFHHM